MKQILSLIVICTLFMSSAFASDAKLAIVNTYEGEVLSGGKMIPVSTSFSQNQSGQIVGLYTMKETTGLEKGELSNLRMKGAYTAVFEWEDQYGTGV